MTDTFFPLDLVDYDTASTTWVNGLSHRRAPVGMSLNASRCATAAGDAWGRASVEGLDDSGLLNGLTEQERWLLENRLNLSIDAAAKMPEGGLQLAFPHGRGERAPDAHDPGLLSIVATTRNDDHGGRMTERMQCFIDGIADQSTRYCRPIEVVLVEWNPPPDRPPLSRALRWPESGKALTIRIVTVTPDIHARFAHAGSLPLYQMIAKNAGIRRARGEYILATNVDILFDDSLFEFISDFDNLRPGRLYRSDRWDVPPAIMDRGDVRRIRRLAPEMATCVNTASGCVAPSDFRPEIQGGQQGGSGSEGKLDKPDLHLNACGDFQLMDRNSWQQLRGYAEFDGYSIHIDSLLGYCAMAHGIRESRLPTDARHFHIDHIGGWSPDTKTISAFTDSLKKRGIAALHSQELSFFSFAMMLLGAPFQFNRKGWGLAEAALPESIVTAAHRDSGPAGCVTAICRESGGVFYDPLLSDRDELERRLRRHSGRYLQVSAALTLRQYRKMTDGGNRPLYVWGAGLQGQTIAKAFTNRDAQVAGLVHGLNTPPETKGDLPVFSLEDMSFDRNTNRPFVVIASVHQQAIAASLNRLGAHANLDYIGRA